MKYFTSILGFCLMLIIPSLLLLKFREKAHKLDISKGNINVCYMKSNNGIYLFLVFSIGVLVIIVINLIHNNNKTCVYDE